MAEVDDSADAITHESAALTLSEHTVNAWTPLSILELSKEHIPCCCRSHVDCLVTQLIGCDRTAPVMMQIRPTGGELHDDATGRFAHPCRDLDQPSAPSAWLPFAKRIVLAK